MNDQMIFRYPVEFGHRSSGLLNVAISVAKTGCFWEEENSKAENDSPEPADTHDDPPGSSVVDRFGTKVDEVGNQDTDGDEQLVAADDGSSDMVRSAFTLVLGLSASEDAW